MELEVGVRTETGKIRSGNEDAYSVDLQNRLFVVADGMGGHNAGEVASRLAVEAIGEFMDGIDRNRPIPAILEEAAQSANEKVYMASINNQSLHDMGTTLVMAMNKGDKIYLAHVGDSRAYALKDRRLVRLTEDHTVITRLIAEGVISEEEALFQPKRGALLRAIGMNTALEVDILETDFNYDWILLCSDGLTDMVIEKEIEDVLLSGGHPQAVCDILVDLALEHGGVDNITVILVRAKETEERG